MPDIYDLIDAELKRRKMSRRKLAIRAGMPESTIAALFARRSEGITMSTLYRIANALDVNIRLFISEQQKEDSPDSLQQDFPGDKNELVHCFYRLNEKGREMTLAFAEGLTKLKEYRSCEELRDHDDAAGV